MEKWERLQRRLQVCRKDYRRIKARIRQVGFICEGSLVERWTQCGKPNCRCRSDPKQRHGPYFQLSWKEKGKTLVRRLIPEHAQLYRQWIDNRRLLESIIDEMQAVSRRAGQCMLADRSGGDRLEPGGKARHKRPARKKA